MKVSELIRELQGCDPNAVVVVPILDADAEIRDYSVDLVQIDGTRVQLLGKDDSTAVNMNEAV